MSLYGLKVEKKRSLYMSSFRLLAICVHEKDTCCVCDTGPWADNGLDRWSDATEDGSFSLSMPNIHARSHMHVILSEWTVTCFYIYLLSHTFFSYSSCVLLFLLLPLSVSLARGAQCCMESDWFFLPFLLSLGFWQNHGSMETKKTALWQQRGRESRIFHICCGKRWWRSFNRIHNHSLTAQGPAMQD